MLNKLIIRIILYVFILFSIGYLDFNIISPLFLPGDICYYHLNEAPFLIDTFYLGNMEHFEAPYNGTHIFTLLVMSLISTYFIIRKLRKSNINW